MSTLAVIILVAVALLVLLALGGALARSRRTALGDAAFRARLAQANEQLAAARAEDKGWELATMEAAAREAFSAAHPGVPPERLYLIQVVDRPGVEEDEAVFAVDAGGARHEVRLGRRGGSWKAAGTS